MNKSPRKVAKNAKVPRVHLRKLPDRVLRTISWTGEFNCGDKEMVFVGGEKQFIEGNSRTEDDHKGTAKVEAHNPNLEPETGSNGAPGKTTLYHVQSKQCETDMSSSVSYRRKLRSRTGGPVEDKCDSPTNAKKRAKTIVAGFKENREIYDEGQNQHVTDINMSASNVLPAEASSQSQKCDNMISEKSTSEMRCEHAQKNNQEESTNISENEVIQRDHSGVQPDVENDAERAKNSENKVTHRDNSCVQPDVEKDAERANNSENKVTQRDHSGVQPDVENDEEGNFHRLTSMEKSNPDRDTVDINCESKVNSPMEKNNHGGESDCKNKVDSPYQLRERPLTLTYKYTRNRKASQQFTCTHKGCEKVPPFKNFTELIVHTEVEHSDDEDDINHGNVFPCKHKNCTILAPFKDFSDLIAHTETEHSDTEDEDEESDGLKGTNQEPEILDLTNHKGGTETELLKENQMANARRDRNKAISSAEKRIVQDAWENFKRNSTAEAESQRYLEGSNGHMCPVCNRVFERKNERNLHVKLHDQMVNMCIHRSCGWTFQRYHELQWHYSTHHRSSATAKESKNPKLRNKIGSPLSPGLEIAGNDSHPFDQSIDVHSGNETSPEGGETPSFNTNGIRREHADIQVVASTPITNLVGNDFTCLRCKRVFKYRKGFLSHVRNHDSMKYKCMESGCGWEFIDFSQVKNHYIQKHNLDIFLM